MKKRICNKCNIEKELTEFYKTKYGKSYKGTCKDCEKARRKEYSKNNKEKIQEYREVNKEKIANQRREYHLNNTLDHHVVYYLPEINYCGVTRHPTKRMQCHARHGNDTTGWKVLAKAKTKKEALEIESKYHSEKAMNGARGWKLQSKNE